MARLHLPCPALPAPALPLPEERFASRLAAGTFLLSGDARPALGIPEAALKLANDAPAIAGVSTGGDATAEDDFNAESKACAGCDVPIDAKVGAAGEADAASDAIAEAEPDALNSCKCQYSCHNHVMQSAFMHMWSKPLLAVLLLCNAWKRTNFQKEHWSVLHLLHVQKSGRSGLQPICARCAQEARAADGTLAHLPCPACIS